MSVMDELQQTISDHHKSLTDTLKEHKASNNERIEAMEKRMGRPNLGGDAKPDANSPEVKSL